jgi:hypothetical protein
MLAALGEGQKPQGASDTARRMVRLAASAAIPSSDQICLGLAYDHLEEHSDFKEACFPLRGPPMVTIAFARHFGKGVRCLALPIGRAPDAKRRGLRQPCG